MEKKRSNCPLSCSLDIIGDKWSLLIIRDVMIKGKVSFNEFLTSEEKIATNILANRLRTLEEQKILLKKVSPLNKSKFEYTLSQKGVDLLPALVEIAYWSVKYNQDTLLSPLGQRINGRKTEFINEVTKILEERLK